MNWLFSAFWGLLATSAATQCVNNAATHQWKRVVLGALFTLWAGWNSWHWAKQRDRKAQGKT